jgi:hypothetical protein
MLKNFEEITKELNDYEKDVLYPIVIAGLTRHVGKDKAISGKEICNALNQKMNGPKLVGPRLRKIIQAIRITGDLGLVCSTRNGYFVAQTEKEIDDCIHSLQQRVNQQQRIIDALTWQRKQQVK